VEEKVPIIKAPKKHVMWASLRARSQLNRKFTNPLKTTAPGRQRKKAMLPLSSGRRGRKEEGERENATVFRHAPQVP
jgi:hypothetical protein